MLQRESMDDFETFRVMDMVHLTLHNPLHDIPDDEEFRAIQERTESELIAQMSTIREKYMAWRPSASKCEFNPTPCRFSDIDDYYPAPYFGRKNDAGFKVYMIKLRQGGLQHIQRENNKWLEKIRKHHNGRLDSILAVYCRTSHGGSTHFQRWEKHFIRAYAEKNRHLAEFNVLSAIPTFDNMVDYIDREMFFHRTIEPIHSASIIFDMVVCFQKYMSRGHFKKPKSRFLM